MADKPAHNLNTSLSLLDRLRQSSRDEMSWQRFFDLYRPWLTGWLRRRVPADVADDLLQDVFVVVCRRLPTFEHNQRAGAFRTWLKEIVKNCLRDAQKKRKPMAGDSSMQEMLQALEDPLSELQQQWDQEHDQHVLNHLLALAQQHFSAQDYDVFCRVKLRGEPALAVATALGIPSVANVYKKVSRVYTFLQEEGRGLIDETSL